MPNSRSLSCAACKRAGCDLELTAYPPEKCRFSYLGPLVKDGKIAKEEIAESAKRLFFTRMSLGEFDAVNPWNNISLDGKCGGGGWGGGVEVKVMKYSIECLYMISVVTS